MSLSWIARVRIISTAGMPSAGRSLKGIELFFRERSVPLASCGGTKENIKAIRMNMSQYIL